MHCFDEGKQHANRMYKAPTLEEANEFRVSHAKDEKAEAKVLVPKCSVCQMVMKSHCMYFDEVYNE